MTLSTPWSVHQTVLKSSFFILITIQAHESILHQMASPDWLVLTPPSILIMSIPISILKPNSGLFMTKTSAFRRFKLSIASVMVPMAWPWKISPSAIMMSKLLLTPGTAHRSREHPENHAMHFFPLIKVSVMGSTSFKLTGEILASTSCSFLFLQTLKYNMAYLLAHVSA